MAYESKLAKGESAYTKMNAELCAQLVPQSGMAKTTRGEALRIANAALTMVHQPDDFEEMGVEPDWFRSYALPFWAEWMRASAAPPTAHQNRAKFEEGLKAVGGGWELDQLTVTALEIASEWTIAEVNRQQQGEEDEENAAAPSALAASL